MGKINLLLVEDDDSVVRAIFDGLSRPLVELHHAPSIAEGKRLLDQSLCFDAVILDRSLPDGDGTELASACRRAGNDVPIVMVTARDTINERIDGLGLGADDYLCKPFAIEELAARLDAVMRRAGPKRRHLLKYADVEVDLIRRQVTRNGIDKNLSARELDLLAFFMCHPDEPLTNERILRDVWGDDAEQDSNVLRVYANYLRNKLSHPRIIHTVRGVGYILSERNPEDRPPGAMRARI